MATIRKTPSATWKAVIRKRGWPAVIKTFRTKRDATDRARRTEDEMVRGIYIDRAASERLLLKKPLDRYETEVCATKGPSIARREKPASANLNAKLDDYSLAAITPDIVAGYRDERLAEGLSASTVRLELALLSHLYTVAIKEWRTGLIYNPVTNIRKPAPHRGRDRRLSNDEEQRLLRACDKHSNPMLGQIVPLALHTGMRAGKIRSLQRSQVNLEKRLVTPSETKNGTARAVPLSKATVAVLRTALAMTCPRFHVHQPKLVGVPPIFSPNAENTSATDTPEHMTSKLPLSPNHLYANNPDRRTKSDRSPSSGLTSPTSTYPDPRHLYPTQSRKGHVILPILGEAVVAEAQCLAQALLEILGGFGHDFMLQTDRSVPLPSTDGRRVRHRSLTQPIIGTIFIASTGDERPSLSRRLYGGPFNKLLDGTVSASRCRPGAEARDHLSKSIGQPLKIQSWEFVNREKKEE